MKAFKFDKSKILVYSKGDLERLVRDISEADEIVTLFGRHLTPVWKAFEDQTSALAAFNEEPLRQLSSRRLFREAQDRLRASQKNSPQSQS